MVCISFVIFKSMKDPLTKKVYKIRYTLLALYYTIWKSIRQVLRLYILEFSPVMCPIFLRRIFRVKKIKMARGVTLTFEEGCNKYLENCRQRNSRKGAIGHYRQSYAQFYKYFEPKKLMLDLVY